MRRVRRPMTRGSACALPMSGCASGFRPRPSSPPLAAPAAGRPSLDKHGTKSAHVSELNWGVNSTAFFGSCVWHSCALSRSSRGGGPSTEATDLPTFPPGPPAANRVPRVHCIRSRLSRLSRRTHPMDAPALRRARASRPTRQTYMPPPSRHASSSRWLRDPLGRWMAHESGEPLGGCSPPPNHLLASRASDSTLGIRRRAVEKASAAVRKSC